MGSSPRNSVRRFLEIINVDLWEYEHDSTVEFALDWVLLTGERLAVTGALFVTLAVTLLALEATGVAFGPGAPYGTMFNALLGGNITLLTIVLSVNQLVLSRQLATPGEVRNRMESVGEYRDDIRRLTDEGVVPVEPPAYLRLLIESTLDRIRGVEASLHEEKCNPGLYDDVTELVAEFEEYSAHILTLLDESKVGVFPALSAVLDADYGKFIHRARTLRVENADALPDDAGETLGEVEESLRQLDVARQYFKSLFMQQELSTFSRHLVAVGVPAVVVAVIVLVTPEASALVFGADVPFGLSALVVALELAPVTVLFAYTLRIATVSFRTASIVPFINAK